MDDDWKDCAKPVEMAGTAAGYKHDPAYAQERAIAAQINGYQTTTMLIGRGLNRVEVAASPADKIRARIKALDEIHATYVAYLHKRIEERDWHGGWDACVNLSETEQEQHGLRQALEALGERE